MHSVGTGKINGKQLHTNEQARHEVSPLGISSVCGSSKARKRACCSSWHTVSDTVSFRSDVILVVTHALQSLSNATQTQMKTTSSGHKPKPSQQSHPSLNPMLRQLHHALSIEVDPSLL